MARPRIKSYKIDMKAINKKIAKSPKYNKEIDDLVNKKFKEQKEKLLSQFENHPVTMELEGGSKSANISGTLNGYGNLFTFIGFPQGFNPIAEVRAFLKSSIRLRKSSRRDSLTKEYSVNIPALESFNFAKMPWESGANWVRKIETGISGFSYYMNKASQASRSGKAIQIDGKLRAVNSSKSVKYMSKIIENFKKRIIKSTKR